MNLVQMRYIPAYIKWLPTLNPFIAQTAFPKPENSFSIGRFICRPSPIFSFSPALMAATTANDKQRKLRLQLYLHHIGEPDPNTRDPITVVSPNGSQGFGAVAVNDWAVHEGPSISSKIAARALGHVAQCSKTGGGQWYSSFSLVFGDGRCVISSRDQLMSEFVNGRSVHRFN